MFYDVFGFTVKLLHDHTHYPESPSYIHINNRDNF